MSFSLEINNWSHALKLALNDVGQYWKGPNSKFQSVKFIEYRLENVGLIVY